jgi:hypothetical protein
MASAATTALHRVVADKSRRSDLSKTPRAVAAAMRAPRSGMFQDDPREADRVFRNVPGRATAHRSAPSAQFAKTNPCFSTKRRLLRGVKEASGITSAG